MGARYELSTVVLGVVAAFVFLAIVAIIKYAAPGLLGLVAIGCTIAAQTVPDIIGRSSALWPTGIQV